MDPQNMTTEYRISKWTQIMQARINSGQSIQRFCKDSGISRNAYFYWQKRLREIACAELIETDNSKGTAPIGWMQLTSEPLERVKESLEIEINDCHIVVTNNTDTELLKKICLVLRSI